MSPAAPPSSAVTVLERVATLEAEHRRLVAELEVAKAEATAAMARMAGAPPRRADVPMGTVWGVVTIVVALALLGSGTVAFWIVGVSQVGVRASGRL
ncbi:MAG TPA: hypothetical protein PLR99_29510 [Polyangiaceae bacterium]|nr:hypothetical protein [Polyangiaceae bacterium]